MKSYCSVCGVEFDGEYIEFNKEKNKDVYKCYSCNGFVYFSPIFEVDDDISIEIESDKLCLELE